MSDMTTPTTTALPDGELRIFPHDPQDDSRMYVLDVLGVGLTVYVKDGVRRVLVDTVDVESTPVGTTTAYAVNQDSLHEIG